MVRALRAGGIPTPDGLSGNVLAALAEAGAFRLRAVVVGSLAFQCYLPMLGFRAPGAAARTGDVDIGQFPAVSIAVDDRIEPDLLSVLKSATRPSRPSRIPVGPFVMQSGERARKGSSWTCSPPCAADPGPAGASPCPGRRRPATPVPRLPAVPGDRGARPSRDGNPRQGACSGTLCRPQTARRGAQAHRPGKPHQGPERPGAGRPPCAGARERPPRRTPGGMGGTARARTVLAQGGIGGERTPPDVQDLLPLPDAPDKDGNDVSRAAATPGGSKGSGPSDRNRTLRTIAFQRSDRSVQDMMLARLPSCAPHGSDLRPRQAVRPVPGTRSAPDLSTVQRS